MHGLSLVSCFFIGQLLSIATACEYPSYLQDSTWNDIEEQYDVEFKKESYNHPFVFSNYPLQWKCIMSDTNGPISFVVSIARVFKRNLYLCQLFQRGDDKHVFYKYLTTNGAKFADDSQKCDVCNNINNDKFHQLVKDGAAPDNTYTGENLHCSKSGCKVCRIHGSLNEDKERRLETLLRTLLKEEKDVE